MGLVFLIHSDTLSLLIEAFSTFTFRVTIERYEFNVIVLPGWSPSIFNDGLADIVFLAA